MFSTYSINKPYHYLNTPAHYTWHTWHGFLFVGGMNMVDNKSIRI